MTKYSNQRATMKNNNDKEKKMKKFNRSATMKINNNEKMVKEFKRSATMKISNNNKEKKMPTRNPLRAISATGFKRKAQQLGKQTYELATLCDILACLVIQKPDERSKELLTANERRMLVSAVDAKIDVLKAKIEAAKAAKHGQNKKDSCDLAGTGRGHGFELENERSKRPVNECGMLLNAVDAKIETAKVGWGKRDSCDEAGIGGGHGFARFLVDERFKKLTAAQGKDLVTELDSRLNL